MRLPHDLKTSDLLSLYRDHPDAATRIAARDALYARRYPRPAPKPARPAGKVFDWRMRAAGDAEWDRDAEAFEAYADACVSLAQAHVDAGSVRDLAAVRMQLRGALKRAAERFEDADGYARMSAALADVSAREEALRAAPPPVP